MVYSACLCSVFCPSTVCCTRASLKFNLISEREVATFSILSLKHFGEM